MPNCKVGYDLMVYVGIKRLLEHRQRNEIISALNDNYGIKLSTGEVSDLVVRFLHYFLRLHHSKAGELKKILENDGRWPMHVDATGENGRGTVLVVMAGWRKWVLGAWKIATEKAELILPCLRETVERFGPPCAIMRDLGRAVTPAIDELVAEFELQIPVLACHQHFLADIGKDILDADHCALRALFRSTKIQADIKRLIRELGGKIGLQIEDARQAVVQWQALVGSDYRLPSGTPGLAVVRAISQWIIDYKAEATGLGFPFDRPYLDYYNRSRMGLQAVVAFLGDAPDDLKVIAALKRLGRILDRISSERAFDQIVKRLQRRVELFDELRNQLRVAKKLPEDETAQDIDTMRKQFDEWVASLALRRLNNCPSQDICKAIDIILVSVHGLNLTYAKASLSFWIRKLLKTRCLTDNYSSLG